MVLATSPTVRPDFGPFFRMREANDTVRPDFRAFFRMREANDTVRPDFRAFFRTNAVTWWWATHVRCI